MSDQSAPQVTPYPSVLPTPPPSYGPGGGPEPQRSRRPTWAGVTAVAAAAALAASVATAGLTGAFADTEATAPSFDALGRQTINIPVSDGEADKADWRLVAAAVRESVVAITVTTRTGSGEGSGVIIDSGGLVLTNDHVVSNGGSGSITVSLADGRLYEATLLGTDPTTDIAVISLVDAPGDLVAAELGDSESVDVGQAVMAVGNPLGLDTTVTTGIVSAVDRPVSTWDAGSGAAVVTNAIQIDAAVNPGNSGGPLFDAAGRVIGITSSIATVSGSTSGSIGLGFAIPVNQVQLVADQLVSTGTVEHAFLGVSLADGTATAAGTTRRGAVIRSVTSGTPAATDLQPGDVVVGIDGSAVGGAESLTGYVRQHAGGDEVVLTIVRSGAVLDVTLTLATAPPA